uniref:DWNN domain-containing protein n=1 Tax=Chromera velia CCMP2878 TaxID=1169474 RepID=A0A0G4FBK1_9ALVE|mmetsp:Transcript_3364/g.6960  ORF Transcript_3364/g.6960 Transcript_3364/m.6960 type:complete len:346 (-) Transcript_3364:127-1164(-)|eukprot:Cvel_3055.t1-p1 / transcript=Cvel_3055.t1 / gene=Cvel_3055 / organism=Chromera_velia_CCMP2878 / gene_product=hypothetical protein / transcript_product=hypothetical protein / location=Cvel_scaffold122:31449-34161(+) / protein_length=345 / sequence_SO=supercontig / SO=protein_coding / is_pseudo=false
MSVYYRWSHLKGGEAKPLQVEGVRTSWKSLEIKKAIAEKEKLPRYGVSFLFQLTNAKTSEEYKDDVEIPQNTTVVVKRVFVTSKPTLIVGDSTLQKRPGPTVRDLPAATVKPAKSVKVEPAPSATGSGQADGNEDEDDYAFGDDSDDEMSYPTQPFPEELRCPKCRCIFDDPVLVKCDLTDCGGSACRACVERGLEQSPNKCPLCGSRYQTHMPNRTLRQCVEAVNLRFFNNVPVRSTRQKARGARAAAEGEGGAAAGATAASSDQRVEQQPAVTLHVPSHVSGQEQKSEEGVKKEDQTPHQALPAAASSGDAVGKKEEGIVEKQEEEAAQYLADDFLEDSFLQQ